MDFNEAMQKLDRVTEEFSEEFENLDPSGESYVEELEQLLKRQANKATEYLVPLGLKVGALHLHSYARPGAVHVPFRTIARFEQLYEALLTALHPDDHLVLALSKRTARYGYETVRLSFSPMKEYGISDQLRNLLDSAVDQAPLQPSQLITDLESLWDDAEAQRIRNAIIAAATDESRQSVQDFFPIDRAVLAKRIAASFFWTVLESTEPNAASDDVCFLAVGDLGGLAFRFREPTDQVGAPTTPWKAADVFKRWVEYIVAHQYFWRYRSWRSGDQSGYYQTFPLDAAELGSLGALSTALTEEAGRYLRKFFLLPAPLGVQLDTLRGQPSPALYLAKRLGNKRRLDSLGSSFRLVVRLRVKNEDTLAALLTDGAANLIKIENYLGGWVRGFLSGRPDLLSSNELLALGLVRSEDGDDAVARAIARIELRADLNVPPTSWLERSSALASRNPYRSGSSDPRILGVEEESVLSRFQERYVQPWLTKTGHDRATRERPFVVYRGSELVGPSPYPAVAATGVLDHWLLDDCAQCSASVTTCRHRRVLDLFSGSGSVGLALAKRLSNAAEPAPAVDLSVLAIDLDPVSLEVKGADAMEQSVVPMPPFVHVAKQDVFRLLDDVKSDAAGSLLGQRYDLIVADPPHYLALEVFYRAVSQRHGNQAPCFYEYLSGRTDILVLYFAHKEQEWLGWHFHRMLARAWRHVYTVVAGDERLLVAIAGLPAHAHDGDSVNHDRHVADVVFRIYMALSDLLGARDWQRPNILILDKYFCPRSDLLARIP